MAEQPMIIIIQHYWLDSDDEAREEGKQLTNGPTI